MQHAQRHSAFFQTHTRENTYGFSNALNQPPKPPVPQLLPSYDHRRPGYDVCHGRGWVRGRHWPGAMVAVLEEGGTKVVQGRNAVLNNRRRVEKLPGDKEAAEQAREDGIGSTSCIGGLSSDRPEDWFRAPGKGRQGSRQVSISLPNLTSVGAGLWSAPTTRSWVGFETRGDLRRAAATHR